MSQIDQAAKKKQTILSNNESLAKQREVLRGIFETKKKENKEFEENLIK